MNGITPVSDGLARLRELAEAEQISDNDLLAAIETAEAERSDLRQRADERAELVAVVEAVAPAVLRALQDGKGLTQAIAVERKRLEALEERELRAVARLTEADARQKRETPPASPSVEPCTADYVAGWTEADAIRRVGSGLPTIDAAHRGGWPMPRVVVVGGAPGAAKTAFVTNQAVHLARRGYPTAIYPCDEGREDTLVRVGQLLDFDRGQLERREPDIIAAFAQKLRVLPLEVFDADELTVEVAIGWLVKRCVDGVRGVLVVDSIQTARTERSDYIESPRERIDDVVKLLKRVRREHRFLVFASSELARSFYRSKKGLADLNDLAAFKESGGIEYAAQTALLMRNVEGRDDAFDIGMPKNRGGTKVPLRLVMDRQTTALVEVVIPQEELERPDTPEERTSVRRVKQAKADALLLLADMTKASKPLSARGVRELGKLHGWGNERTDAARVTLASDKRIHNAGTDAKAGWAVGPAPAPKSVPELDGASGTVGDDPDGLLGEEDEDADACT